MVIVVIVRRTNLAEGWPVIVLSSVGGHFERTSRWRVYYAVASYLRATGALDLQEKLLQGNGGHRRFDGWTSQGDKFDE